MTDAPTTTNLTTLAEKLDLVLDRLNSPTNLQRYLSVATAAKYCDLCESSIRNLLASGKLRSLRPVRGSVRIDKQELDDLIQSSAGRIKHGRGGRMRT